eukprot:scaffold35588_cov18-Tisochrysis_lutea.AAC.1
MTRSYCACSGCFWAIGRTALCRSEKALGSSLYMTVATLRTDFLQWFPTDLDRMWNHIIAFMRVLSQEYLGTEGFFVGRFPVSALAADADAI